MNFSPPRLFLRRFFSALRFLTILPVPGKPEEDLAEAGRAASFFPAAGLVIGFALGLTACVSRRLWSWDAACVLTTACWAVVTGGLHLDGLSDTVDGLGGGRTPERRLEIMKDSRIGAFGAVAVVLALLLKTVFLGELDPASAPAVLLAVPAGARLVQLACILAFPPARREGMGVFFKACVGKKAVSASAAAVFAVVFFLTGAAGAGLLAAALAFGLLLGRLLTRLLGGLTGDTYGAVCELSEIFLLAGFGALRGFGRFPFAGWFVS